MRNKIEETEVSYAFLVSTLWLGFVNPSMTISTNLPVRNDYVQFIKLLLISRLVILCTSLAWKTWSKAPLTFIRSATALYLAIYIL